MADKKYREKYKQRALTLGLCTSCYLRIPLPQHKRCKKCTVQTRVYRRSWRRKNPEKQRLYSARCEQRRPGRFAENRKRYLAKLRDSLWARYGANCVRCGFTDKRALQFDHIQGGGSRDRRTRFGPSNGSHRYWKYILEAPAGVFQVLCANCNSIKRHEQKEWPNS